MEKYTQLGLSVYVEEAQLYFRAKEIGELLQINNISDNLRKIDKCHRERFVTLDTLKRRRTCAYLDLEGVKQLICRSRSLKAPQLAKVFGITIHDNMIVPIETTTISFLCSALEGTVRLPQFTCLKYKIDLYLPDYAVAVECDEEGSHGVNRVSQDTQRQAELEAALHCAFVRFRPQSPDFNLAKVLNECLVAMGLL